MRLASRVAIVTGAGRGLGRAYALRFAREGASVVIADVDLEAAEQTAAEVRALGTASVGLRVDVAHRQDVEAMVERAVAELGKVDILVNNAGISLRADFLEMKDELWDSIMAVNLKGTYLCSQVVAREMVAAGRAGCIINVASQRGERAGRLQTAYCVSKAGVQMLTKAMALDLAPHGIRVNAIAPSTTLTDMNRHRLSDPRELQIALGRIPMGRLGEIEDMVGPVVFLASDEARYMTGHCLFVDGGWLAGDN